MQLLQLFLKGFVMKMRIYAYFSKGDVTVFITLHQMNSFCCFSLVPSSTLKKNVNFASLEV